MPVLVLLFLVSPAWADLQTFTVLDGLCGNDVLSMVEDSSGNLWFGTFDGVCRYDGVTWTTFTTADGLLSNNVRVIYEDSSGAIWFGSDDTFSNNGVSRYDGKTWTTYDFPYGNVQTIFQDSHGFIWVGQVHRCCCWQDGYDCGVKRFDGVTWRTFTTADGLADNNVFSIYEDASGTLWFATGNGLNQYDGTSWTFVPQAPPELGVVQTIAEDRSGGLWFGTIDSGLFHYDGTTWSLLTVDDGLTSNAITSSAIDRWGNLWLGTGLGAMRYNGTAWTSLTEGFFSLRVASVLADELGNVWFGSVNDGAGVARYDGVLSVFHDDVPGGGIVESMFVDTRGDVWVATSVNLNPVEGEFGLGGGVHRYDSKAGSWTSFTSNDGLAGDMVMSIGEDSVGRIWAGCCEASVVIGGVLHEWAGGVSVYDGTTWSTITMEIGPASNCIEAIAKDSAGMLWLGGKEGGLTRFDGIQFEAVTDLGSPEGGVLSILEDSDGNLWFGTGNPVIRYDGRYWTTYTPEDGLPWLHGYVLAEDSLGGVWAGGRGGAARFDGTTWTTYDETLGSVTAILVDDHGDVWFALDYATGGGVTRFNGTDWVTYAMNDGLPSNLVKALALDREGNIWFGTDFGVGQHSPDRTAPKGRIAEADGRLFGIRDVSFLISPAFGENRLMFSYSLDGQWSDWISYNFVTLYSLVDGIHEVRVRARDAKFNLQLNPTTWLFEVDATPPEPRITEPFSMEAIQGNKQVQGTAWDTRFKAYRVRYRPAGEVSWEEPAAPLIAESTTPVVNAILANWDVSQLADGEYELRVEVVDSLGLMGPAVTPVIVDNEAPWAYETTPATVSSATGGDVYTTDGSAHVFFPPHAFRTDATVRITAAGDSAAPDTLMDGSHGLSAGYVISWDEAILQKAGILNLSSPELQLLEGESVLYLHEADGTWNRIGGTLDEDGATISSTISRAGHYALFTSTSTRSTAGSISALTMTPRVFSPHGGFSRSELAISFSLERPSDVTVKVLSRSGRLVKEVASNRGMNQGINVVGWDGRGSDGAIVRDGLYLVTVESREGRQVKTVAVVR